MMQAIWKGAVSFGLVHVPVKMYSSTEDKDIPLRMLHREYKEPIQYRRTCPKCEEEVPWSDIVKGYEYKEGQYVIFEQEELEDLVSETSREIRIIDFVDLSEIDPIYFQKTYYLSPEETGRHAYMLLVNALESTQKIGVAHVTIRQKSSLAAVRVIDGVLSLVTMFYAEEFRDRSQIPNLPDKEKVDRRELDMAKMLIEHLTGNFEPEKYRDEYKARLRRAIEDKMEGKEVKPASDEKTANVLDLMDALQASLKQLKPFDETDKDSKPSKRRTANRTKRTGA
ncbi:Non-homologous end joining protein Ku [Paenibacillus auburnensis]|uniref:Non-homologous end joining protein Ku n=2 Tax=Paenibacillus auburnensis TaxID=2905649 RepID=A0ABM9BPU6_9BACL|nr:Non-homologous end joining protein Ku [Paenibacillus auburnensis]